MNLTAAAYKLRPFVCAWMFIACLYTGDALHALEVQDFTCNLVQKGDQQHIVLRFSTPHALRLAVRTPRGQNVVVVSDSARYSACTGALMSEREFSGRTMVELLPSTFRARPCDARATEEVLVFAEPGSYEFLLGENLAEEDWLPIQRCRVELQ